MEELQRSVYKKIRSMGLKRLRTNKFKTLFKEDEDNGEEDLSMISDASSGPRNIYEEDSVKIVNSLGPKKQNKRENNGRDYEKMTRFFMILLVLISNLSRKYIGVFARLLGNSLSVSGLCLSEIMLSTHDLSQKTHYMCLCIETSRTKQQSKNIVFICI
ncbi:hypothetical protein HID58_057118 [Brassica napus]|uniref:BnaC03g66370D protein n=2 Tax=Brassica napus TaxID=3708 RepID=A0A078GT59_BRANA|nr:hypothetical protein HID58_057118 [Brassica napus]CAF1711575.1 unnamed protein product [Brassica napus]CDY28322.1 BnaC03g66370D [Brassica napus]